MNPEVTNMADPTSRIPMNMVEEPRRALINRPTEPTPRTVETSRMEPTPSRVPQGDVPVTRPATVQRPQEQQIVREAPVGESAIGAPGKPRVANPAPQDQPIEAPEVQAEMALQDMNPVELPEEPEEAVKAVADAMKPAESKVTRDSLEQLRQEAEEGLRAYYPGKDVEVRLAQNKRDLEEQADAYESGASQTPLSLHNFGLAGDYDIYIDGKKVTGTPSDGPLYGSTEPYQVLGHFARKKGMFWGWGWDSRHVGETRFVVETLKERPQLAENSSVKKLFNNMIKQDTLPRNLEGLVTTLGDIYGKKYKGKFTGEPDELDTLLDPIDPYNR